jgi:2-polyprenyl-6-methoxyphenol hydroxylase-like FAD-dependent oxidoreductase
MKASKHFDIVISGNGPVGCIFSLHLSKLFSSKSINHLTKSFNYMILEKQKKDFAFPLDFPTRNFSLTNSNLGFLNSILDETGKKALRESGNYYRGMQIWKENEQGVINFGENKGGYLTTNEM